MKITRRKLQNIIKEEVRRVLHEISDEEKIMAVSTGKKFNNEAEIARAYVDYARTYGKLRPGLMAQLKKENPFAMTKTVDQEINHLMHLAKNPGMYAESSDDEQYRNIATGIKNFARGDSGFNPTRVANLARNLFYDEGHGVDWGDPTIGSGEFRVAGEDYYDRKKGY